MKKFSAKTLDSALLEASKYFNCSLTQIEYEVVQNPSNGILGIGKKEAIIVATQKYSNLNTNENLHTSESKKNKDIQHEQKIHETCFDSNNHTISNESHEKSLCDFSCDCTQNDAITQQAQTHLHDSKESPETSNIHLDNVSTQDSKDCNNYTINENETYTESITIESSHVEKVVYLAHKDIQNAQQKQEVADLDDKVKSDFDNSFYDDSSHIPWQDSEYTKSHLNRHNHTTYQSFIPPAPNVNIEEASQEVQEELIELLKFLPLDLTKVQVKPYDSHTLSILIDGLDAALLIGQKGYRYKSLSYLLFNWINIRYGYGVRLEIAQFLKNQEEMIRVYLEPIIESAKLNGKAQTKPLDGVLTHVALKILRDELPNKYIVFRDTADGEKYITISDFLGNQNSYRSNVHGFGNSPKY
ncbi:hypothetical protein CQA53_03045 [Helicobacter didelphidarum]|uniref:RNA-binding protein KhpB N-terminal domain-containing protein n=1 Tax=Helicobacter didelphidarum TaxID=2040648 RepID=A0A3D8IQ74_9HELI|nr:Jag N-terminal domain-containing protein [Helicobacter didelphidarum]RDU66761.1 hypothetical protein CQA53_03045 [Helicobacter didelphidarum]